MTPFPGVASGARMVFARYVHGKDGRMRCRFRRHVVVLTAVVLAAGCGGRAPGKPSADPSVAAAGREAMEVYRQFVDAVAAAQQAGRPDTVDLSRYARDPLLQQSLDTLERLRVAGVRQTGAATVSPRVDRVSLDTAPPTVILLDCVDTRPTGLIDRAGKPLSIVSAGPSRYRLTATVTKDPDWRVAKAEAHPDSPC